MKVLLIGSSGMLGQAIQRKLIEENISFTTVSRTNSVYRVDLAKNLYGIIPIMEREKPTIIINAAGLVSIERCEENPALAYEMNARLPGFLNEYCRQNDIYFIQISTDHFFCNAKKKKHCEAADVVLLNEYARTKYASECFTLTNKKSLVIRTNIVGFRGDIKNPTFIEWIIKTINNESNINGFVDYYTSSIDVYHFSDILFELIRRKVSGLYNVGSSDVLSKYEFIENFTRRIGKEITIVKMTLSAHSTLHRADSLGLNVRKVEKFLGGALMPTSEEVIDRLITEYEKGDFNEL